MSGSLRRLPWPAALFLVLLAAGSARGAAAAENGDVVFAGTRLGKPVIYMRGLDPSRSDVLPTNGWAYGPAASPGGRRIAFRRNGRDGAQIWTVYTDGTAPTRLTAGPHDREPRWSPAGDAVVFARGQAGRRAIYTVRADASGLRRLTFRRADDHSPAWSARGRIAFVRGPRGRRGGGDIYAVRATGGRARRLTNGRADDRSPAWAPSGRRLAFARGRPGRHDLYLLSADGRRTRRLTALPGDESEPAWSPDRRAIAFTHVRAGRRRLLVLRIRRRPVLRLSSRALRVVSSSRVDPRSPHWQPAGVDPVVVAAGDIACDPEDGRFGNGLGRGPFCHQRGTSDLLLRMDLSAVLALGDLQYEDGKLWKFQRSFDPSWGRLKPLIRPVPGNHEYRDRGAAGYFDYFNGPGRSSGPAGERGRGYYSFDIAGWHLIALNSECSHAGGCGAGSPQERWLRQDLAGHPAACTLAFWHQPRFTSGQHPGATGTGALWSALYEANADLVLNGHEHFYERFSPQTPQGDSNAARGIRQFIVGTGGKSWFGYVGIAPNSEVRFNRRPGVLKLELRDGAYTWELVTAPAGRVADAGSASCH
jgi:dipeptidyl aminopeptidase/acylaminoacyl peptidase